MSTMAASSGSKEGCALTLDAIVGKTNDLPSLPAAAMAVMRETGRAEATAGSVARVLGQDQSLAVRVLRLANSAYYGLPRQVDELTEAVVMLGMRNVRSLCLVASTYPWLVKPLKGYDLGPRQMWAHALSVGVGAQLLAQRSVEASPEVAFTAGILHDLGKTALSVWLENKIETMARIAAQEGFTFDAVERKVLGFDHQVVGAHMASAWNLPDTLSEAMRTHHCPLECAQDPALVYCVHVADFLSMNLGIGLGGDQALYEFRDETLEPLHLNIRDLDELADEVKVRFEEQDDLFREMA